MTGPWPASGLRGPVWRDLPVKLIRRAWGAVRKVLRLKVVLVVLAVFAAMTTNFLLNNGLTYRDQRLTVWRLARGLVTFYAIWPIMRNAVVGLRGVDPILIESARGMGMNELTTLWRIRLPMAWPVIHAGIRISTQMSMGIAAIASLALGPGLGTFIYTGLSKGGTAANGLNYTLVGTVGIVFVALIADGLLLLLGRLTVSKGIR